VSRAELGQGAKTRAVGSSNLALPWSRGTATAQGLSPCSTQRMPHLPAGSCLRVCSASAWPQFSLPCCNLPSPPGKQTSCVPSSKQLSAWLHHDSSLRLCDRSTRASLCRVLCSGTSFQHVCTASLISWGSGDRRALQLRYFTVPPWW